MTFMHEIRSKNRSLRTSTRHTAIMLREYALRMVRALLAGGLQNNPNKETSINEHPVKHPPLHTKTEFVVSPIVY